MYFDVEHLLSVHKTGPHFWAGRHPGSPRACGRARRSCSRTAATHPGRQQEVSDAPLSALWFQPHYSNPLVAAKLLNIPRNTEVDIVCKILAEHVTFDNPNDPFEGKVEFKLKIQK